MQRLILLLTVVLIPAITIGADVKVLSWNVYMIPQPLKSSLQRERKIAIPELLRGSDYDLMFFQEAYTGSFRDSMIERLSGEFPYHFYMKRENLFNVFGSGVFVMSRYPFKVIELLRYKDCAGIDCFADKGTYIVEVELLNGKTVQFLPTHMQSQEKNRKIRFSQLQQIREMLAKYKKRGVPQVLLGDLNIAATSEEFHQSLDLVNMNAVPISGEIVTTSSRVNECYKTGKTPRWIDHVWVEKDSFNELSTLRVLPTEFEHNGKNCPLSDHHAVEANLNF